jgi:HlyD family secretion protein
MQVLADIDEADVGKIREKMKGEVVVDAFPGERFKGLVTQVRFSPNNIQGVVTYSAVVEVENPELKLRPGMTATVTIKTREANDSVAVRNAALRFRPLPELDAEGKPITEKPPPALEPGQGRVYLVSGDDMTDKVISVGITDGVWTEVKNGDLATGTELIVEQREDKKKKRFGLF